MSLIAFDLIHLSLPSVATIPESSWVFYAFWYFICSSDSGRGRAFDMRNDRTRPLGRGGGSGSGKDKIDALGRLL